MKEVLTKFADEVLIEATPYYKAMFVERAMTVIDGQNVTASLLQTFLESLKDSLICAKNKGKYILGALRIAVASGRLSAAAEKPSIEVSSLEDNLIEDTESVEKDIDEWFKIMDEYDAIAEKKGFKPHYRQQASGKFIDKYGNVRGHFDGKGGFIYTDGTKSSRWPTIEEKHDGGATF